MSDSDDEASIVGNDLVILTAADEVLRTGLELLGYNEQQINRKSKHKRRLQIERFVSNFGLKPHVVSQVWEDLQVTTVPNAQLGKGERDFEKFLFALEFLKMYERERQRETKWHHCVTESFAIQPG